LGIEKRERTSPAGEPRMMLGRSLDWVLQLDHAVAKEILSESLRQEHVSRSLAVRTFAGFERRLGEMGRLVESSVDLRPHGTSHSNLPVESRLPEAFGERRACFDRPIHAADVARLEAIQQAKVVSPKH